ncbi:helix-turn-helix transcriptional regulator [Kitasatospora sp. NPDC093102]|uniref:helix-turn-helix domain-containing protein n=1 Tax=Kitasatospora sp. NPDC093102 TaxID=3155069 RepID=UPI00341D68F4
MHDTVVAIRRCLRCSAYLSRSNSDTLCGPCRRTVGPEDTRRDRLAEFRESAPVAAPVVAEGPDLGAVLRNFRTRTQLKQLDLADLLGFSQSYVSLLERGKRTIRDIAELRRIAAVLRLPEAAFGLLPLAVAA